MVPHIVACESQALDVGGDRNGIIKEVLAVVCHAVRRTRIDQDRNGIGVEDHAIMQCSAGAISKGITGRTQTERFETRRNG